MSLFGWLLFFQSNGKVFSVAISPVMVLQEQIWTEYTTAQKHSTVHRKAFALMQGSYANYHPTETDITFVEAFKSCQPHLANIFST